MCVCVLAVSSIAKNKVALSLGEWKLSLNGIKVEKRDRIKMNRKETEGKRQIFKNNEEQQANNNDDNNYYIIIHTNNNGDVC